MYNISIYLHQYFIHYAWYWIHQRSPKIPTCRETSPSKDVFFTKTQDEGTYTPEKATAGLESRWCSFSLFNSVIFRLVLDFRLGVWLASTSNFFWVSFKMWAPFWDDRWLVLGWQMVGPFLVFQQSGPLLVLDYRWSYNPCKCPKGNGCFTCVICHIPGSRGVVTLLITGDGAYFETSLMASIIWVAKAHYGSGTAPSGLWAVPARGLPSVAWGFNERGRNCHCEKESWHP